MLMRGPTPHAHVNDTNIYLTYTHKMKHPLSSHSIARYGVWPIMYLHMYTTELQNWCSVTKLVQCYKTGAVLRIMGKWNVPKKQPLTFEHYG